MTETAALACAKEVGAVFSSSGLEPLEFVVAYYGLSVVEMPFGQRPVWLRHRDVPSALAGVLLKESIGEFRPRGDWILILNKSDTVGRKNYTIMHELYHLLTGQEAIDEEHDCTSHPERPPEVFAREVLMPEHRVRDVLCEAFLMEHGTSINADSFGVDHHGLPVITISRAALSYAVKALGVSWQAFKIRLTELAIQPESVTESLWADRGI